MKTFLFLSYGFTKPTPAIMESWGQWFAKVGARIVAQDGLGAGREFTPKGSRKLGRNTGAATGYIIFKAKSLAEAEKIAMACPIIASNVIQEIMPMGEC